VREKQLATRRNFQCPKFSQSFCVHQHAALRNTELMYEFGVYITGKRDVGGGFGMEVLRLENKSQYMKVTSFVLSIVT
jgi:hypothetical protein